ncbi:MAG: polysaccharide deacetylase family protein [Candidatus Eisenbacteria bacterium]|nr:polysaccharide deacetylase family protein [Candidatus Eisenbacteria bacterium]
MVVLAYHQVDRRLDFAWNMISPERLARQMELLARRGWRGVPFREAIGGESRIVGITFDDALDGVVRFGLPVLRSFGFRATLFVPTAWAGRRNGWDTRLAGRRVVHAGWDSLARAAGEGWEIGSHGHTHRDLTLLPAEEAEREIRVSREIILRRTGIRAESIAWPFGQADERLSGAARRAGFRRGCLAVPDGDPADPFRIGRIGVRRFDGEAEFLSKIEGGPLYRCQVWKDRVAHFVSLATPRLWQRIRRIDAA